MSESTSFAFAATISCATILGTTVLFDVEVFVVNTLAELGLQLLVNHLHKLSCITLENDIEAIAHEKDAYLLGSG